MGDVEGRDVRAGPVALGRVWLAAGVGLAALAGLLLVVLAGERAVDAMGSPGTTERHSR